MQPSQHFSSTFWFFPIEITWTPPQEVVWNTFNILLTIVTTVCSEASMKWRICVKGHVNQQRIVSAYFMGSTVFGNDWAFKCNKLVVLTLQRGRYQHCELSMHTTSFLCVTENEVMRDLNWWFQFKCGVSPNLYVDVGDFFEVSCQTVSGFFHDGVISWKRFPHNWSFVRRIHQSPVDPPNKGAVILLAWASCGTNSLVFRWLENPWSSCHYNIHDDVIKWKHFPRYWPFVRGIHRSPVNSPHKGQWRRALMFSLFCIWINGWVNNRGAGDLRRYRAHYDASIMIVLLLVGRGHMLFLVRYLRS